MSARKTTLRDPCAEQPNGCREVAFYEFRSQREADEHRKRHPRGSWRCTRHRNPNEVLGGANRTSSIVLTAARSERHPDVKSLFWQAEGEDAGSGLIYGPGFKAFANDFVEGARIRVTATLEPPATTDRNARAGIENGESV